MNNKLLFRLCEAGDGRTFAFLTDQPEVEGNFDNGYKISYKYRDNNSGVSGLPKWKKEFTALTEEFELLPDLAEIPESIREAFNALVSTLIKGVDVFFCDYNLGIEGDLPMCNEVMDMYTSTDFVLFSCADIVGNDPRIQPYMVSYAMPRYDKGDQISQQHRIYSKTDYFAFCQAINAIVDQRNKDELSGGHIRSELTPYINESVISEDAAKQAIEHFVTIIKSGQKAEVDSANVTSTS